MDRVNICNLRQPSFVTGLPRTRTYWFSRYFDGLPGVTGLHEALNGCRSRTEFYQSMEQGVVVNCDCGLYISDWDTRWPDASTVVVHRDPNQVLASLETLYARLGWNMPDKQQVIDQSLAMKRLKGLHVEFDEIDERLEEIHQYLVSVPFSAAYASEMSERNMQCPEYSFNTDSYLMWVA